MEKGAIMARGRSNASTAASGKGEVERGWLGKEGKADMQAHMSVAGMKVRPTDGVGWSWTGLCDGAAELGWGRCRWCWAETGQGGEMVWFRGRLGLG